MKTIAVAFSESSGAKSKFDFSLVDKIAKELEEDCPLENLYSRRAWRDSCLTQLSQLKKSCGE